jgi:hypothetical protein
VMYAGTTELSCINLLEPELFTLCGGRGWIL